MIIWLEDGFSTTRWSGIGRYTLNLYELLRDCDDAEGVILQKPEMFKYLPHSARRAVYVIWINSFLLIRERRLKPDIVHFTNFLVPYWKNHRVKHLSTIHDLVGWRVPHTLPKGYLPYIRWATRLAVTRSDLVVTVSQAVKDEIVEVFSLSPDRVRVVPNVVPRLFAQMLHDPERVQEVMREHGIRKPYALFVGTLEARKNVVTLLKAFSIVHARESDIRLVLVGRPGFGFEEIQKTMQSLPHATSKDVVFTGSVPDEQLVHLYDGAEFLVLPSLYEGFGIPLVEAMARGIPLVVSDIPSSREVAGEAALYYGIDPRDHEALAEAMWRLLREESLKQKLLTRGTERIKMFSWNAVREKLIATYMQVCGRDR